jgi:hypothetical protein
MGKITKILFISGHIKLLIILGTCFLNSSNFLKFNIKIIPGCSFNDFKKLSKFFEIKPNLIFKYFIKLLN